MKKNILFIVNPISGTRKWVKNQLPALIEKFLDHQQYSYTLEYTKSAGHARELAAGASAKKTDLVIVAGGDGTVNEVVESLVFSDTTLGIIPLGSGNGLARHLKYPMRPSMLLRQLPAMKVERIDVVEYEDGEVFCSTAGLGFDAFVTVLFEKTPFRGFFSYGYNILRAAHKYPTFEYTLTANGSTFQGKAFVITAFNSNQYGYNIEVMPEANLQDGKMDIFIIKKYPKWKFPFIALKIMTGNQKQSRYIENVITDHAVITSKNPVHFQVDGETGHLVQRVEMKVIPKALKVIIPNQQ